MKFLKLLFIFQSLIFSVNSENITNRNITNKNLINKKFLIENCNFNYITHIRIKFIPTIVFPDTKKINFTNYNDIIDKKINLYLNVDKEVCRFFVKKYRRILIFNNGRYYRPRFIFFYDENISNNNCIDFSLDNKTLVNNACYVYNDIFLHNYIPTSKYIFTTPLAIESFKENINYEQDKKENVNNNQLVLFITIPIAFIVIIMLGLFYFYHKKQNRLQYEISDIENQISEIKNNIDISIKN